MSWYLRPRTVVAIARDTSYVFVVPDRRPVILEDVDVDAMSEVLGLCAMPVEHAKLVDAASEDTIEKLLELGVIERGTREELVASVGVRIPPERKRCRHVVVGLTGAVASATAIHHVTAIADLFADTVDVVLGEGAQHFVRPELYQYYGFRTWTDPFTPMHGFAVPHEQLAMTTELVLVAPASASTIQRLANGECSDMISLIVAATQAPVVVAPSMNPSMWGHPAIMRNIAQLRADGFWVIEPAAGILVAQRETGAVGGQGFEPRGLLNALDVVLETAAAEAAARG